MEISTSKTTYSANTNSANFCGPKINTTIKNTSTYSSNESLYNDSNNPYNKIDAYRKNHATDEQIKKDIEKYNSTVTDQFLKLDVDEALSNIKKEISKEKSNPFEGQTISPSNPLDQAAPISSNPNEQYAIPSAKNWYDKNKISYEEAYQAELERYRQEQENKEFMDTYGAASILLIAGSLLITLGVIVTIIMILRGI